MGQRHPHSIPTASPLMSGFPQSMLPALLALHFWETSLSHPPPAAGWRMRSDVKERVFDTATVGHRDTGVPVALGSLLKENKDNGKK